MAGCIQVVTVSIEQTIFQSLCVKCKFELRSGGLGRMELVVLVEPVRTELQSLTVREEPIS